MTNYEWLVKNDKLENFLDAVYFIQSDSSSFNTLIYDFGIDFKLKDNIPQRIAQWLQEEHIEHKKYVLLDDVIEVMNTPIAMEVSIDLDHDYIPSSKVIDIFTKDYVDKITRLNALPTKEIEE